MKTRVAPLLAILMFLASQALATSTSVPGPFVEIDKIAIDAFVGDTLSTKPTHAEPLFAGATARETQFLRDLVKVVSERLKAAGIEVSDKATDYITLRFFGGDFKTSEIDKTIVFLLMVSVSSEAVVADERTVLGTSTNASLEADLVSATLVVVDELIYKRKMCQERTKVPSESAAV